ncbi:hypothetical protein EZV62_008185 [Acer yangbiense]|uniref:Aminotransferase-like plant mobile domain-containing protein n=1 Tax=Acer yangbiense TaxID=1000413 RepID=A0A5C7IC44_9ROSI|nr:hypothetical protein EZV62_008185 [Acer yangbiense]
MEGLSESDVGIVEREELMVPPSGDGEPTMRVAHFLQPTVTSIEGPVFELPANCLSSLPHKFEPKNWPLKMTFYGCIAPKKDWKFWVGKMASLHESTWKKAGIYEAILNSTYSIQRQDYLVLGLAEKWCPETKSFIFSWGEATITLEDMIIFGYSVLGSSVFSPLETDELKSTAEKLNRTGTKIRRTAGRKVAYNLWKKKFMDSGSEIEHEAFLVFWLSRFVFPVSYAIVKTIFPIAIHLARGTRIALAPAVLAHIYRDLSLLNEKIVALAQLDHFENEEITLHSPLQLLVQIWAWERFLELRPKPNLIQVGESRFAQWHKKMLRVENVKTVLDSAEQGFDWRPYTKTLKYWNFPKFYAEREMWVLVDPDRCEELESFARCLRISELIGRGCVEHYFPHQVPMQFGLDQDLPACVAQVSDYNKPISYANLYVPPRLYEADVTTQYLEWWKDLLHHLQAAKKGMRKRKSEETSTEKEGDSDAFGSAGLLPSKMLPLNLIIKKELNESPFPPGFPPKTNLLEARDTTNGDNLTIEKLLISNRRQSDVGNKEFPPGFPPKSNLVDARDTTKEDNLTTKGLSISSKRHDDVGNGQLGEGEDSSGHCQKLSSSKVVNEADKIVVPLTELIEKPNELVERRLETALEDAIGSKTGSTSNDMERSLGVEGNGNEHESEIQELQIEDWVSRLERTVAELKSSKISS